MKNPAPFFSLIGEVFFPEACPLCGKALYSPPEAWYGLCGGCREQVSALLPGPDAGPGRCSVCGRPLISEISTCLSCRNGPERSFDRVVSLFPYAGEYEKLLKSYKFGEKFKLGRFFHECLTRGLELLSSGVPLESSRAAWVPVPPRPGKIKKNGWDQIEYLARLLEKTGRVCRCLKRLPSLSQKELNRDERRHNLKGRILAVSEVPKTAVLFDDVYTTGSTMDACAEALKNSGAREVYGVCLYYD